MMHLMQAKGFKAPGAFPDGPDPLGPILDRGGGPRATAGAPRAATGAPRAPTGPKDTKLNGLGLFDEANEKLDVKPELKMAANGRTTMQQQLSNAQGWRDNETTLPFYDNDNNRAAQWPPKVTAEGHYVTLPPPPPPLPLDPLSPPFPAAAAAGVGMGVGEGSGRVGQSSFGGISVIRTAADMVRTRSAGAGAGATRGAVGAGPGPGGGSSVRSSGQRQRGHRGGRQREKTPTFISEEEKLNWEKERRKKDIHNKVEQRRRYNINDRIQDLGNLLISGGLEVRQSKGAILRETIQYIRTLHSEQVRLGNFESFNGKLEIENNKLFSQIQRIEMLLQAHGYQTATAATTGHQQQLYATEDNQQLHHSDLVSPTSYFSALKEETLTSEQYHHHHQQHHHAY